MDIPPEFNINNTGKAIKKIWLRISPRICRSSYDQREFSLVVPEYVRVGNRYALCVSSEVDQKVVSSTAGALGTTTLLPAKQGVRYRIYRVKIQHRESVDGSGNTISVSGTLDSVSTVLSFLIEKDSAYTIIDDSMNVLLDSNTALTFTKTAIVQDDFIVQVWYNEEVN